MWNLYFQIFISTPDTDYFLVYLHQFRKARGYGVYTSIKSQVPENQCHSSSKTFKLVFFGDDC